MYKCNECGYDSFEATDNCPMCSGEMNESVSGMYRESNNEEEKEL